ncbi:MAG: glycosyltransferase family 39 protein [Chitinophagaceae bacterium]|nr:glycosyltransferase family 39 protein [Chitinophagaceae bacterium]
MHQSFFPFLKKKIHSIGLGLIVVFYILNGAYYIRNQSLTSDEADFLNYAFRYVKGQPDRTNPRVDNSKLPVSVLNLTPRMVTQVLNPSLKKEDGGFSDIMNGRYVTLFVSVFTILLVYVWSKELYGKSAGLFSAFLMSVCPNNISLAGLVTTDAYSVLFLLLNMYLLWKFCKTNQNRFFLLFSVVLAVSQLVKQSLFHLYVLAPAVMIIYAAFQKDSFRWLLFLKRLLVFAVIQLVVINTGYYFHGSFMKLGDYHFMSNLFQGMQQALPGSLRLPFPRPFVDGLDMVKYYDQLGGGIDKVSSFGKVTILGNSKTGGGFWYYYFVTLFYKTPIPYLVFLVWSIVTLMKQRTVKVFIQKEFFLLAPVVYFLLMMSFFYQTQCGIRHIVFIYPFLFIVSGF